MLSQELLDHFTNPRNAGELPPPAVVVEVTNPACGDILRLSVLYEGEKVVSARFKTRGCTAAIAASSALTVMLEGQQISDLMAISRSAVEASLGGLPPESQHVSTLCVDAVRRALAVIKLK